MKTLVVAPCGVRKRDHRSQADILYTGSFARVALRYSIGLAALQPEGGHVVILSAKHGLLELTDVVDPYDVRLGDRDAVDAAYVRGQAAERGYLLWDVIAVGGEKYVGLLREVWPDVIRGIPIGLGGIGLQMAFMNRRAASLEVVQ